MLAFLAVSVVCALAAPLVRMESDAKWNGLGWRKMASALPTDTLKVQIAIKQENVEQLEVRTTPFQLGHAFGPRFAIREVHPVDGGSSINSSLFELWIIRLFRELSE